MSNEQSAPSKWHINAENLDAGRDIALDQRRQLLATVNASSSLAGLRTLNCLGGSALDRFQRWCKPRRLFLDVSSRTVGEGSAPAALLGRQDRGADPSPSIAQRRNDTLKGNTWCTPSTKLLPPAHQSPRRTSLGIGNLGLEYLWLRTKCFPARWACWSCACSNLGRCTATPLPSAFTSFPTTCSRLKKVACIRPCSAS